VLFALTTRDPQDPIYRDATRLLERSSRRLAALLRADPDSDWLPECAIEDECLLAMCHSKAGQTTKAVAVVNEEIRPLLPPHPKQGLDPGFALRLVDNLARASSLLESGKQKAAALTMAQQAASLNSQYANSPVSDPGLLERFGEASLAVSASLNRLGEASESLRQAELAKTAFEEASRSARSPVGYELELAGAVERIAKARWNLGRRREAMDAFHESAAIRNAPSREPSDPTRRTVLSQSYDRLVFYCSRGHELKAAADALVQRERLWPNDAKQLMRISDDFSGLADWVVVRGQHPLSPGEMIERDRYVSEGKRVRQAAEAAARRSGSPEETKTSLGLR